MGHLGSWQLEEVRVPGSMGLASYTLRMSVTRDELHHLVDQLPEERLASVLELIRGDAGHWA